MGRPLAGLISVVFLLAGCAGQGAPEGGGAASPSGSVADASTAPASTASGATVSEGPGAYVTLAEYEGDASVYADDDVVLFFTAPWCSSCKKTRENIEANLNAIPSGLVIVTVDYDSEDELKRAHGVTVQHTFVQIDADGTTVKKWTGSLTAEAIAEQTV